jgi:hypothetical protein
MSALVGVALCGALVTAEAAETAAADAAADVRVTATADGAYHADNANRLDDDDDYGVVTERLNLNASSGELSLDVRLDGTRFFDRPSRRYKHDLRLERLGVAWQREAWTLRAGDLFVQLGRGLVLSLRKQDEIGLDQCLRGGEVGLETDRHAVRLFAGTVNPANLDAVSQKYVRDPGDALAGGSYSLTALGPLTAGLLGAFLAPRERLLDSRDSTGAGGFFLELAELGDAVSVYLEGDLQRRLLAGSVSWGQAGYATADAHVGDSRVLLEGVYLHDFEMRGSTHTALGSRFVYNRPPTLQRIEEEVLASPNLLGGRLRLEQTFGELVLFANGLWNIANFGEPSAVRQLHAWGGGEWTFGSGRGRLALSGGYRDERQGALRLRRMPHAELDCLAPLPAGLAAHLISTVEHRTVPRLGGRAPSRSYARGSSALGVERRGLGQLTFELGYDTQDPSPEVRRLFYAGIITWEVSERVELAATVGTQRGGIKCLSGVCREYPAFAGARLEAVGRF